MAKISQIPSVLWLKSPGSISLTKRTWSLSSDGLTCTWPSPRYVQTSSTSPAPLYSFWLHQLSCTFLSTLDLFPLQETISLPCSLSRYPPDLLQLYTFTPNSHCLWNLPWLPHIQFHSIKHFLILALSTIHCLPNLYCTTLFYLLSIFPTRV